jgi:site-specific recombinase XerD
LQSWAKTTLLMSSHAQYATTQGRGRNPPAHHPPSLRHSHASALIAGGVDVLTVSRRIGHASVVVTLGIYSHLFSETDKTAAKAIEAAMRRGKER